MKLCTDSSKDLACPITHTDFAPGQIVYVLKSEVSRLEKEQAVTILLLWCEEISNPNSSALTSGSHQFDLCGVVLDFLAKKSNF